MAVSPGGGWPSAANAGSIDSMYGAPPTDVVPDSMQTAYIRSARHRGWWHSPFRCRPGGAACVRIGSWNVEGVGASYPGKIEKLIRHMDSYGIGLLGIQETYVSASPWYYTDEGYLVILSGGAHVRERAGVGFIVAPHLTSMVVGFRQISNRLAILKLRVRGGCANIVVAYAPHGGYKFDIRYEFFAALRDCVVQYRAHGPTFVIGDLNVRLHTRRHDEQDVLGPYVFGNAIAVVDTYVN